MARSRPQHSSEDFETPDSKEIDIGLNAPLDNDQIYVVTNESMKDDRLIKIAAEEKKWHDFMKQKVTFVIHETEDENAPNPVSCGVNGVHRHYYRGQEYTDARMFVDSLIKCVRKVKTVNFKNAEGVDDTKLEVKHVLAYPLEIIEDPAGKLGRDWFKHQQRNAF